MASLLDNNEGVTGARERTNERTRCKIVWVVSTVLCTGQFNEVRAFLLSLSLSELFCFFFSASSYGCYLSLEALAACFSQRVYHLVRPVVKNKNERMKKQKKT